MLSLFLDGVFSGVVLFSGKQSTRATEQERCSNQQQQQVRFVFWDAPILFCGFLAFHFSSLLFQSCLLKTLDILFLSRNGVLKKHQNRNFRIFNLPKTSYLPFLHIPLSHLK